MGHATFETALEHVGGLARARFSGGLKIQRGKMIGDQSKMIDVVRGAGAPWAYNS